MTDEVAEQAAKLQGQRWRNELGQVITGLDILKKQVDTYACACINTPRQLMFSLLKTQIGDHVFRYVRVR
jgi:hypothetical protein